MVVHSKEELAAAIGDFDCDYREVVIIEWHRPSGITTYKLRPRYRVEPLKRQLSANGIVRRELPRSSPYRKIAAKVRRLKAADCG